MMVHKVSEEPAADGTHMPGTSEVTLSSDITKIVGDAGANREPPLRIHKKTRFNLSGNGYWDRSREESGEISKIRWAGGRYSSSLLSEESVLDHEVSFLSGCHSRLAVSDAPSMQPLVSGAQHSESSAAYFRWPPTSRLHGTVEERATYFNNLQKDVDSVSEERIPNGQRATTLLELMTIRAFNSKELRCFSLGTAIGFRTRHGVLTDIPAIIVFVARKVHREWLHEFQRLPHILEGPGGVWCDVDVVEFAYYGAPAVTPKEQVYTELVEGLRGNYPCIGPGSQVASQETSGTLGAIVQSRTGIHQVGFLTNRHVAVDLDYPYQKMFHPLPPNLGPGVYLGAVERATSFITDDLWYGIFASMNPETFVRADGAFIPFADSFDMSRVMTTVKGVDGIGDVVVIDLQAPIGSIVGKQVIKVGRSSGLTKGSIMAYALEYNDEKGICFFTDFLIVGENKQAFDLEGDSGSLILMIGEEDEKPRPVGIIWGGTANRGRLKLRNGHGPENWTSGVDLDRLLELLQLDLITNDAALSKAMEHQRHCQTSGLAIGESFLRPQLRILDKEIAAETSQSAGLQDYEAQCQHQSLERGLSRPDQDMIINVAESPASVPPVELELMKVYETGFASIMDMNTERGDQSALNDTAGDDLSCGLHLCDREANRRRPMDDA